MATVKVKYKEAERQENKKKVGLYKEVTELILKRSGLTKKDIADTAIRHFAVSNVNLLNPTEIKKYQII